MREKALPHRRKARRATAEEAPSDSLAWVDRATVCVGVLRSDNRVAVLASLRRARYGLESLLGGGGFVARHRTDERNHSEDSPAKSQSLEHPSEKWVRAQVHRAQVCDRATTVR